MDPCSAAISPSPAEVQRAVEASTLTDSLILRPIVALKYQQTHCAGKQFIHAAVYVAEVGDTFVIALFFLYLSVPPFCQFYLKFLIFTKMYMRAQCWTSENHLVGERVNATAT